MVASAPRVDMGPGLPATAYRKCRTATSHDELPRALLHRVKRCSVSSRKDGCDHFISVYTKRKQEVRTCRDALCSNSSCQSKKGESCIADCSTTFPRLSRVGELRNREDAANVRSFFELRFAENCAEPRPACVSALLRLLKACESSLKKPSACTTCGASLLNFREVLRVALAGSEFLLFYKSAITLVPSGADFPSLGCRAEDGGGARVQRLTARVWRGSGAASC